MKILFVYRNLSTFIKKDYNILRRKHKVILLHATKNLFKTLSKLLWKIRKADLIFVWFAGWHAFLAVLFARIFKKKSIVVAGGYDATCVPEINYGAFCSWWRGRLAKWVFENADLVLAVSNYTKNEVLKHTNPKKIEIVYNGIDYQKYKPKGKKENIIITVGNVTKSNLKKKGLETFVKSAKYLSDFKFILIGKHNDNSIDYLKSMASSNVEFTGFVSFKKLLKYYQKAKVYVQVSAHESFGCSLAEAMLCGCIPVVTRRGAIPEVVGDVGFYVPYNNPKATANAIRKALGAHEYLGKKPRERIKRLFSLEKRREELLKSIEVIMNE